MQHPVRFMTKWFMTGVCQKLQWSGIMPTLTTNDKFQNSNNMQYTHQSKAYEQGFKEN